MENTDGKIMRCKGTVSGTRRKCGAELCEIKDGQIHLKLESGRKLIIYPKRSNAFSLICDNCGYETHWYIQH